ncbi:MAG TPA: hypothetical protein VKB38_02695 [Terracidiphilus sp.]|nr:hypothetical protein [Terracidiphilus sp.]
MSDGRYRLLTPHNGQTVTIQASGIVCTGAGMFSPHPLQRTVKSQSRESGMLNT